jgi:hypothetical protein
MDFQEGFIPLFKSRPNEDNSIVYKGYFVSDFNVNYEYKCHFWGFSERIY